MAGESKEYIIEGSISKGIIKFMLPIMLGMFFQQLYNTVDAVVVGRFVGKEALAAVGGGTMFFVNLLIGFCGGLANGASIIISQFFGAKNDRCVSSSVHTFVILSILLGFAVTIIGVFGSGFALNLIKTPKEIFDNAIIYLRIYFLGIILMFLYNTGASILRATGDSKTPFWVLVAACFVNIILDCFFVAVLNLGVAGVAYATIISEAVSMVIIFIPLVRTSEVYRLDF
ncbi:MAG: polysaccharide biosynthesis C-terminal domain-containing protein, partial [Treponema sp.]|nr:polysaccharide biosynthesis C-terminal domain-containing protein [Treponema sp.]